MIIIIYKCSSNGDEVAKSLTLSLPATDSRLRKN